MINNCVFTGRFVQTPELKATSAGTKVSSFTLAVERSYSPKGEKRKADFIDFVAWRGTAEFICRNFQKGDMIAITGELQTRTYEDQKGNKRKATELVVRTASYCGNKPSDASETAGPEYSSSDGNFEELSEDEELPF